MGEGMTGEHEGDARGGQGFNAENKLKNYKNKLKVVINILLNTYITK